MASQWPAIIGTLSGTSLGVGSTWLLERSKWRRQRGERWDEHKRVAFSEYLLVLDEIIDNSREWNNLSRDSADLRQRFETFSEHSPAGTEVPAAFGLESSRLKERVGALDVNVSTAMTRLKAAAVSINMFAPGPVLEQVELLAEAAKRIHVAISNEVAGDDLSLATQQASEARKALIMAIRRELL